MPLTEDNLIVIAAALAAMLITALIISIWQGFNSRREVKNTREQLSRREEELAEARADQRGQSVALEQTQEHLQTKQSEVAALSAELETLNTQLNASLKEHAQLQTQQKEREDNGHVCRHTVKHGVNRRRISVGARKKIQKKIFLFLLTLS